MQFLHIHPSLCSGKLINRQFYGFSVAKSGSITGVGRAVLSSAPKVGLVVLAEPVEVLVFFSSAEDSRGDDSVRLVRV